MYTLYLPLLEQRQLLAKEEILCRQSTVGMHCEGSESDQVDDDQRQRPEAVCKGAENRCVQHERSGLHVTERYRSAIFASHELFAEHNRIPGRDTPTDPFEGRFGIALLTYERHLHRIWSGSLHPTDSCLRPSP